MINVNRTETIISGSVNGKPFSVTFDDKKYALMKEIEAKAAIVESMADLKVLIEEFEPLTKESYKEIVETLCPYLLVNRHSNKFYLKYNNVVSSKAIPQALVDRILKSVEKCIDITPLIKAWVRFLRNPNFTDSKAELFAKYINAQYTDNDKVAELETKQGLAHSVAVDLSTTTQVAITMEGLIVGYKVSREVFDKYVLNEEEEVVKKSRYSKSVDPDTGLVTYDEPEYVEDRLFEPAVQGTSGDDFWCVGANANKKGHHIRVGCSHFLDSWEQVNINDSQSCVKGLHVGGLNYIKGYQSTGTVTHNVLIDPMDIGAVCDIERGDGAIRVKRYFVHSSFAGANKNIYHSSKYAAMNDEEYQKSLEEVVNKTKMSQDQLQAELEEVIALSTE